MFQLMLLAALMLHTGFCEKQITIEAWQFCAGCKGLVELYTGKASKILSDLEEKEFKKGKSVEEFRSTIKLDANQLTHNICENDYYKNYIQAARYTCMMIMQDYKDDFIRPFVGAPPEDYRQTKGNFFDKSKEICSKALRACPIEFYERGELPPDERTKCSACHIIGDDLETIMNVAKYASPSQLLESVCISLGFNHKPHTWIEELCEEIVEDHSVALVDVMNQHLKGIRKGEKFVPSDHVLADKMCSRVLNCPLRYADYRDAGRTTAAAQPAVEDDEEGDRFAESEL